MRLMGRVSAGFQLMKDSVTFVSDEKDLLLYPMFTGISYIFILLFIGLGIFGGLLGLETLGVEITQLESDYTEIGGFAALFIFYTLAATATTFFSTGLVYCSIERFRGNKATVKDGLSKAWQSKWIIIKYGMFSAVIGVVLRILERKFDEASALLSFLGGIAWVIATFFVVPSILYSGRNSVRGVIKDSASTFKDTWGETAGARIGINIFLAAFILVTLIPVLGIILVVPALLAPVGITYAIVVLFAIAFYQVSWSVIKASLYLYATTGNMPREFQDIDLDHIITKGK